MNRPDPVIQGEARSLPRGGGDLMADSANVDFSYPTVGSKKSTRVVYSRLLPMVQLAHHCLTSARGSADSKTRTRRTLHRHRSYDGQCTSVAKDQVEVEAEDASMIKRCVRCGSTIKAGQTYFVRPQLVTKVNSRDRRFNIWSKSRFRKS